jgi:transposase-like protein
MLKGVTVTEKFGLDTPRFRFTLSYRDVENLLAERGLDISYETVRRRVLKFGRSIARRLRWRRLRPSDRWHLDEMVVRIAGERMYPWGAVDHQGEVLDMPVQRRRDSRGAANAGAHRCAQSGVPWPEVSRMTPRTISRNAAS